MSNTPAATTQRPATSLPIQLHLDQLGHRSWVQVGDHLIKNIQALELRTSYDDATRLYLRGLADTDMLVAISGTLVPDSEPQVGPFRRASWEDPTLPAPFHLVRDTDVTGVSGTGVVAEGIQYTDGHVSLRWHGKHKSTVCYDSILDVLAIHGHGGHTRVVWL